MSSDPIVSLIIPVFNRPEEIRELLESIINGESREGIEVVIVEDGSSLPCDEVLKPFESKLNIKYLSKSNSGPGHSRNVGAKHATGRWCVFLDSDVILPKQYIVNLRKSLEEEGFDLFGGPDRADDSFTDLQKSINYSMTSFFTTGGIRGSKKSMEKFKPRSFNLGISKKAFNQLNGFGNLRFGEDIDFSLRAEKEGLVSRLIPELFVFHKRRTSFKAFFKQVFNSGIARILLNQLHPGTLKVVHLLPAAFVIGHFVLVIASILSGNSIPMILLLVFPILVFIDSLVASKKLKIAFLSIIASYTQLFGYGLGFIKAFLDKYILRRKLEYAYRETFYD